MTSGQYVLDFNPQTFNDKYCKYSWLTYFLIFMKGFAVNWWKVTIYKSSFIFYFIIFAIIMAIAGVT